MNIGFSMFVSSVFALVMICGVPPAEAAPGRPDRPRVSIDYDRWKIVVRWDNPSLGDDRSPIAGYCVRYRKRGWGGWSDFGGCQGYPNQRKRTKVGYTPGATYEAQVQAYDRNNAKGSWSASGTVRARDLNPWGIP